MNLDIQTKNRIYFVAFKNILFVDFIKLFANMRNIISHS